MKHFNFAMKWHEILKTYSEDIRREVYDAIIEYAASGEIIEMQPLSRMAFDFIRYEIDENARRKAARLAKKQQADNPQKAEQTRNKNADRKTNNYAAIPELPKTKHITGKDKPTRNFDTDYTPDVGGESLPFSTPIYTMRRETW